MGQRSSAETVVAVYQRFLQRRTWKQAELARAVNVSVRQLRVVLAALQDNGVPLEQEDDPPHVYWSVPKTWLPGGLALRPEEVAQLVRLLSRAPRSTGRDQLMKAIAAVSKVQVPADDSVIATSQQPDAEQQYLPVVEDAGSSKRLLSFRYFSASRGNIEERQASVHRVFPEVPARFVATCGRSRTLKWFRVDRVISARLTAVAAESVPDTKVQEFVETSVSGYHAGEQAKLYEFFVPDPEARWVSQNLPAPMIATPADGGVIVTARAAARALVARYVLSLGGIAQPRTPELKVLVRALARGVLEQVST